jgi:hypothetical protein
VKAKQAADLGLHERLKECAKWHFRGISMRKIAEMMGYSEAQVRRDVALISSRIKEFDDLDRHLRDIVARLGEEITKLSELEAEQWKLLDWATEEVIQVAGPFGTPVPVLADNGQPQKDQFGNTLYEKGPRKPNMVPIITAQLSNLSKQKAEYLKIIGPKVDISVNLNLQLRAQALILEKLRTVDKATYAILYNELQVLAEANGQKALPSGDVIDAEFRAEEIEHENAG